MPGFRPELKGITLSLLLGKSIFPAPPYGFITMNISAGHEVAHDNVSCEVDESRF